MSFCASCLCAIYREIDMKICSICSASNPDSAKFCNDCGTALTTIEPALPSEKPGKVTAPLSAAKLAKTLSTKAQILQGKRKADIMFVLDCTGSMQGEIDAIKSAIMGFADTIESDGVRVRVGLIEFRDRMIGEEARALRFGGEPFTRDPAVFRHEVSALSATGGGDEPESSLDAIMLALRQPFAPEASKVIVLVTDAPPHIPDKETSTIDEVAQALRAVGVQQYPHTRPRKPCLSQAARRHAGHGI
jgi:Mg-chelatase subunit ChlD